MKQQQYPVVPLGKMGRDSLKRMFEVRYWKVANAVFMIGCCLYYVDSESHKTMKTK